MPSRRKEASLLDEKMSHEAQAKLTDSSEQRNLVLARDQVVWHAHLRANFLFCSYSVIRKSTIEKQSYSFKNGKSIVRRCHKVYGKRFANDLAIWS